MCLYPRLIKNPKYKATKKNGGNIPAISDIRVTMVPIGCGKCIECRKQEARKWQIRLLEDVRHNTNGKFITLTFSNESILELSTIINDKNKNKIKGYDLDNKIAKVAVRRFLERWRKKYKTSLRHWFITELGHNGTKNIHMHGIVWTNSKTDEKLKKNNENLLEQIEKIWSYGMIWPNKKNGLDKPNYVNEKTVNYLTKYVHKVDKENEYYKAIVLTSAGIGSGYTKRPASENNKYKPLETKETYTTRTGHQISLPIYWRNKIYSEEEREKLWLEKLDKQERWVCGEKIDISHGDEEYYKVLEYHRAKNKRLGYGDDEINWNKKNYENEQRTLKQQERIKKAIGVRRSGHSASSVPMERPITPNEPTAAVYGGIKPNENINWDEM